MQEFIGRYTWTYVKIPGVVCLESDYGKFMNHSLMPNTDFRVWDKGYALTDIAHGRKSPATIMSATTHSTACYRVLTPPKMSGCTKMTAREIAVALAPRSA
jgi:hypothetical protein